MVSKESQVDPFYEKRTWGSQVSKYSLKTNSAVYSLESLYSRGMCPPVRPILESDPLLPPHRVCVFVRQVIELRILVFSSAVFSNSIFLAELVWIRNSRQEKIAVFTIINLLFFIGL